MKWAVFLLVMGLCFYIGFRRFERANLYFPDPWIAIIPRAMGMTYQDVTLKTADNRFIDGWWLPAPVQTSSSTLTVLFCHGNAGNISHRLQKVALFHKIGLNVFLFDYAGYGKSEGSPSEKTLYHDGDAAYAYLTQTRNVSPSQIILYGESLGGGVATEMALRHPARALILESAFTSTADMAKEVFPALPLGFMIRDRFDSVAKLPRITTPLLVLHSPTDEIIPFRMGRALYDASRAPKYFVQLQGSHNEGFVETGETSIKSVDQFLNSF